MDPGIRTVRVLPAVAIRLVRRGYRASSERTGGIATDPITSRETPAQDARTRFRHPQEPTRLYRSGEHPPLRGTAVALAGDRFALYTRGSVDFYGTYPGMYVPVPIGLRPTRGEHRLEEVAGEVLALTKLNWNHSQLDGHLPITLHAANKVKAILRWLSPDDVPARRYANYM